MSCLYNEKNQLERVADSYDKAIDLGRKGIDLYQVLPEHITTHPYFHYFEKMREDGTLSDSGQKEIKEFLAPKEGMQFIDLGCCLNLMFRGYDQWPSLYHGVDISSKTIQLLNEYSQKQNLRIGSLFCGSMHETPYEPDYFEIGACIGSLEYFQSDFIEKALQEIHRILRPGAKFVLDIPDAGGPEFEITRIIEEYLGRPDAFDLTVETFETLLEPLFAIEHKRKVGPMIQYYLSSKKS